MKSHIQSSNRLFVVLICLLAIAGASVLFSVRSEASHGAITRPDPPSAPAVGSFTTLNGVSRIRGAEIKVQSEATGAPWVSLRTAGQISTGASAMAKAETVQPLALAAADFDEDGVPDLVTSYVSSQVSVMRGNVDAIYPNSPEAQERRQRGDFTGAAFLLELNRTSLPEPADLIGTGDFDADGHWDIVATRQGGDKLYWLRGDGMGGFAAAKIIYLPGTVTSMATGEMNRADGLTDVAVGVVTSDGPRVLVFESPNGALRGAPESFVLPAPASALALGQLDDDSAAELAIATGNDVMVVHGRDRKLSLDAERRAEVPAAQVSRTVFESAVLAIAAGDFTGDAKQELAVLTADGNVRVLERGGASGNEFQANNAMTLNVATSGLDGASPRRLLATKVSSLPKDDLLVFGGTKTVDVVTTSTAPALGQPTNLTSAGSDGMSIAASLPSDSEVTAVLPMRLNASALKDLVVLEKSATAPSIVAPQAAATFVVNITGMTNDKNPGDGICEDTDANCSYDAALQESNAHAGADTINFNIPGNGVPKIISSGLFGGNAITDPVTIDGTTQPGGRVEIAAGGGNGIQLFGGNSVVRGLATYADNYVFIVRSSGNIIEGNYIGLKADGTKPTAGVVNTGDIVFDANSPANNLIGGTTAQARNIISGSNLGLSFSSAGPGNIIRGNYFGTNPSGTAGIANNTNAIRLVTPADYTVGGATAGAGNLISGASYPAALSVEAGTALIQGNRFGTTADGTQPIAIAGNAIDVITGQAVTIGGTTPAARNVISASTTGIRIGYTAATNSLIQGNFIGTNAAGTGALPNLGDGIWLQGAPSITIGGTAAGAGNVISGNGGYGIVIGGGINNVPSQTAIVQGNLVGTDVNGVVAIPNTAGGVYLSAGLGTLIGGTTPEARNVISGNSASGISFAGGAASDPNRVEGNYIGVNRFGTGALGNAKHGIYYRGNTNGNNIGGLAPGAGNRLAFNGGAGIASGSGSALGGAILSNSIFSNAGLGIDRGEDGVTLVAGGSSFDNPVLTSVTTSGSNTTITGRLRTYNIGTGQTPFTIQFFSNTNPDPSGYGEGQVLIGQTTVTSGSFATVSFTATITPAVPPGRFISAVAVGSPDINAPILGLFSSEFSFNVRVTGIATPANTPLLLNLSTPSVGGDLGDTTITIVGEGIAQGATVRLRRAGQADIESRSLAVSPDGSAVEVTFDLGGKLQGDWDIVVTNPDGTTATLPMSFTIRQGTDAQVWVDVLGRSAARPGQPQTFQLIYGNRGNTDANGVIVALGMPPNSTYKIISRLGVISPNDVPDPDHVIFPAGIDWSTFPEYVESDEERILPFIVPVVPAGGTGVITIQVTFPLLGSANVEALISPPLLVSSATQTQQAKASHQVTGVPARVFRPFMGQLLGGTQYINPDGTINHALIDRELKAAEIQLAKSQDTDLPNPPDYNEAYRAWLKAAARAGKARTGQMTYEAFKAGKAGFDLKGDVIKGLKGFAQDTLLEPLKKATKETLDLAKKDLTKNFKKLVPKVKKIIIRIIRAIDPNEKVGSAGAGTQHFITGADPIPYAVFFENKAEASAPAQGVVITDQLDTTKLDMATFQLGPVVFGKDTIAIPPPGLSEWASDIDLRPVNNLIVRVTAALDKNTGVVTWRFFSIDPTTKQPTENALAGFLPPNKSAPEGEGAVTFTISAKSGQPTGTEIRNKARIVFDQNAPIDTPEYLNTIDNSLPASHVLPLAGVQSSIIFNVNWTGTDTGSGIQSYDVYSSENGGPFTLWQSNTTATSGAFIGQPGKSYAFYSISRDGAGNTENNKTTAEASTSTPTNITNAIDDARFYVRQHYLDFLNREPDPSGWDFWTNQITSCAANASCTEVKRINVSAAFYISIEFQETGYLVERIYKTSYGDAMGTSTFGGTHTLAVPIVRLNEFLPDTQGIGQGVVVGQTGWETVLENNKQAFTASFVQRTRFTTAFPTTRTPAQFVDMLFANAGVTPSATDRNAAISEFGAATNTTDTVARGRALRRVAENSTLNQQEFNRAFVLMQYLGYLRRNPNGAPDSDYSGYDFWLTKLNQFNGNFINAEMVKAFITSTEYRQRFGP